MQKLKGTCAVLEYIASPNIIEINNLPIFAAYSIEKIPGSCIIQLMYQVNSFWKSSLEDVVFNTILNSSEVLLIESNFRGEITGNTLTWKANKLASSQKGILEARLKCKDIKIDHTKIVFKSNNTNLSKLSASFSLNQTTSNSVLRYMAEIMICNN